MITVSDQIKNELASQFIYIADEDDLKEIFDLQKIAYQSEAEIYNNPNIPPLIQTLDEFKQEAKNSLILKVVIEGKIVGSVRATLKNDTCYIGKLIVHPDNQNNGIGRKLMHAIEKCFGEIRYELFTGHLSQKNLAFYKSLGFQKYKTEIISEKLQMIFLEKYA